MKISFKWLGGGTWILHIDDITIACDPVLCPKGHVQDYRYFKTKRLNEPIFNEAELKNVNLWLLTHNHEDHIDKYGIEMINESSAIIAHKSLKPYFKNDKYNNVQILKWNQNTTLSLSGIKITIKAIPAIHAKKQALGKIIGNGNGYFLGIDKDGKKYFIYVTGDSVFSKNIQKYFAGSKIDLIIANAGAAMIGESFLSKIIGRITNNIDDIKNIISELHPKLVIPVHWGTFSHYSETINKNSFINYSNVKLLNVGEAVNLS